MLQGALKRFRNFSNKKTAVCGKAINFKAAKLSAIEAPLSNCLCKIVSLQPPTVFCIASDSGSRMQSIYLVFAGQNSRKCASAHVVRTRHSGQWFLQKNRALGSCSLFVRALCPARR